MIFIIGTGHDPFYNLAVEQYIFDEMPISERYFLLWQNANTIVVGKYQNTAEEIDTFYAAEHKINVVRRLSGGGAVYHDLGNLNFSFITDQGASGFDFRFFTQPIIRTLAKLGIEAEFNSRNDLTIAGKKFSGNAQYFKNNRVMHHGTLLFDSDLDVLQSALKNKPTAAIQDEYVSKSRKSVRSRVTNITEHLPRPLSLTEFQGYLLEEIAGEEKLEQYFFTGHDSARISEIANNRYRKWEWNYGSSPAYNVKKTRVFDGGSLQLLMDIKNGQVNSIRIHGDFFGSGDIASLEQALTGTLLNEYALNAALSGLPVGDYINGLSSEELVAFLLN